MNETLTKQHTAGQTVYFCVNEAGSDDFFDFDAGGLNFVALGAATTPTLAAAEHADAGGTGKSHYVAALNLSQINPAGAAVDIVVVAYEQAGGSPDPATDSVISQPVSLQVQFGAKVQTSERPVVKFGTTFDTTAGNIVQLIAWLEHRGEVVDLQTIDASASCSITLTEQGSGMGLHTFTVTDAGAGPNSDNRFELEKTDPGFETDKSYKVDVVITENGTTHKLQRVISVYP